jgi:D-aminopeptidase
MSAYGCTAPNLRRPLAKAHQALTIDKSQRYAPAEVRIRVRLAVKEQREMRLMRRDARSVSEVEAEDAEKILLHLRESDDDLANVAYLTPITERIEWINTRLDAIEALHALSDFDIIEASLEVANLIFEITAYIVQ